jgi:hypothetical protein
MDALEQENGELRKEVTTLKEELDKLNAMVASLVAAHNQPLIPPPQATIVSEIASIPISAVPVSAPHHIMPEGYPWGMPLNDIEGFQFPTSGVPTCFVQHANAFPQHGTTFPTVPVPQSTMAFPTSIVHTAPIYHEEPTENVGAYGRMDSLQDQFDKMQLEIKALRGNDLFGKDARDLCLVPNVKIPPKFKVPDFEKYKGNSCPQSHLVIYARKMSTQTDDHQLLIHYFQDSLTGAALKWYMGLDSTSIRTFNDLGEAFNTSTTWTWHWTQINSEPWPKETKRPSRNMLKGGGKLLLKSAPL